MADAEIEKSGADPDKSITRWSDEIELYDREAETWLARGKKIVLRYKDERKDGKDSSGRKFNMLWSNTETMRPALFARNPKPDIQRRFKDADPIGRVASDVLERCASFFVETDHFHGHMRSTVMDFLLPGRGTMWVRYVPHMKPAEIPEAEGEVTDDVTEGDEDLPQPEVIDTEEVGLDFVHYTDFGHNICRTWDECWLVWRIVYLDRDELKRRFGDELGEEIPLDYVQKNLRNAKVEQTPAKASIYECWDKKLKEAIWLHKDVPEWLDKRTDPLELENFFPTPKPLLANMANDSLIPTPIYTEYQDQADELDRITARIASLTKAIKFAGVYDASAQGISRLLSEGIENKLIPVDQWAALAAKGGLAGVIAFLPIKEVADTVVALYQARDKVKQDLYEITGMADIIRGQSDPNETASAQQIKSNFASMRLSDLQQQVQFFAREIVRLVVDVIGGHFQMETIAEISGVRLLNAQEKQLQKANPQAFQQLIAQKFGQMSPDQLQQMIENPTWEEVEKLIRNATARTFRIDIETDSTIKSDQNQDKADRTEFLKAAGGFLQQAAQAGEQNPAMVPLLSQMLMFGVRAFPIGKELEGTFESTIQQLEKQAAQMVGKPKPNPEMEKVQGDLQVQQARVQSDEKLAMQQAQIKDQQAQRESELDQQRQLAKMQSEERLAQQKITSDANLKLRLAHIDAAAKIKVAQITAGIDNGDAAEAREASAEGLGDVPDHSALETPPAPPPEAPKPGEELPGKIGALIDHLSKPGPDLAGAIGKLADAHVATQQSINGLHKAISAPREIVRDAKTGKPTGMRVKADPADMGKKLEGAE